jgi:hypothetical protein
MQDLDRLRKTKRGQRWALVIATAMIPVIFILQRWLDYATYMMVILAIALALVCLQELVLTRRNR